MEIEHNASHLLAKRVATLMQEYDAGRLGLVGGYPSDWMILGDLLIIATLEGADFNEPTLSVHNIDEFVKEQEEHLKKWGEI